MEHRATKQGNEKENIHKGPKKHTEKNETIAQKREKKKTNAGFNQRIESATKLSSAKKRGWVGARAFGGFAAAGRR